MRNKKVLLFIANPLVTVPPPVNAARVLARKGYEVLLVGYNDGTLPEIEKIDLGTWLLRVKLISRRISLPFFRRVFTIMELYIALKRIKKRYGPEIVVLFNELGVLLNRFLPKRSFKLIHWALEFPENYTGSIFEDIIHKLSVKYIHDADAIIFPTEIRKAMTFVLNKKLLHKNTFIIHNAPIRVSIDKNQQISNKSRLFIDAQMFFQKHSTAIKIVYAGAVGNRYAWDKLIKAVCKSDANVCLLILGAYHDLGVTEFNKAIDGCGKTDRINWLGAVPYIQMEEILAMADIGFVSYVGDTLNTHFSAPGKLYEYLKQGLAVLTDEKVCIKSDLENDKSAYILPERFTAKDLERIFMSIDKKDLLFRKRNAKRLFDSKYNMLTQMRYFLDWLKNE